MSLLLGGSWETSSILIVKNSDFDSIWFILWQSLTKVVNSTLSKLMSKVSHKDYKRTWQGVSNVLLPYLYKFFMVHANNR